MNKRRIAKYVLVAVLALSVIAVGVVAAFMFMMWDWGKMTPDLANRFFLQKCPRCTVVEAIRHEESPSVTQYTFKFRKPVEPGLYEQAVRFSWGDGVWFIDWEEPKRLE
jgi:hypothetical protein